MLEHVMGRGAKVDQEPVHHSRLTVQSDAETIPDLTAAAVAADKIVAAQLLCVPKIRFGIDGGERRDKLATDDQSVQADSRRPGFALHVESKAGSRNPGAPA